MRITFKIITALACLVSMAVILVFSASCTTGNSFNIVKYDLARDSFAHEINDNLMLQSDKSISEANYDRGFRGETYVTIGSMVAYPSSTETAYDKLDKDLELYSEDGVKIMQITI